MGRTSGCFKFFIFHTTIFMPSKYNPKETSPDVKVSLVDLVSALRILDILPEYVLAVVEIEERKRQQLQTGGQASRQGTASEKLTCPWQ